jgi:protocatechuate 3,4-dioxygenase beta subunit
VKRLTLVAAVAASLSFPVHAAPASAAFACEPTPVDGAGPFGRGSPPRRAKIGTGHILNGVVLAADTCKPIRGVDVEFWQSNKQGVYAPRGSATVATDRNGRFRLQGPFPANYEGLPPHIHIRVSLAGYKPLLTRYAPAAGARRGSVRLVLEPDDV